MSNNRNHIPISWCGLNDNRDIEQKNLNIIELSQFIRAIQANTIDHF